MYGLLMPWQVELHVDFEAEFNAFSRVVRIEMASKMKLLEIAGPSLKRPHADTLVGSRHANMKELRLNAEGGVWRMAYAFDPRRKAIVLVAGDKSGASEKRFYRNLIAKADLRFEKHLGRLDRGG